VSVFELARIMGKCVRIGELRHGRGGAGSTGGTESARSPLPARSSLLHTRRLPSPEVSDAGHSDATELPLREPCLGDPDGHVEWVELTRSVIHDLPLADRLTEVDFSAVKPHVPGGRFGNSQAKRESNLSVIHAHLQLRGARAGGMGGDELDNSSGAGDAGREPAHLLGAVGTDTQVRPIGARTALALR
jgi:hypothetical protein